MIQLLQELKDGKMELSEVPIPQIDPNSILVKNHYSVISVGTESKTVSDARKNLISKALSRKKEVKQVLESIKSEGLSNTYKLVMNKLTTPSPLGYSCAGEVIKVGASIKEFKVGDRVACGGSGAVHAEIVSVPKNLCVKLPDNVETKTAAFSTIASIAIQGIRLVQLSFGESCLVIGLGLIGQITLQVLSAAGIKAIGVDVCAKQVDFANKLGFGKSFDRDDLNLEKNIYHLTGGFGVDGVIITAATASLDPINFAGKVCRQKGKVVIVGAVPTGFVRENYYKKELELKMSMSYGPGRYDTAYEERGIDYPIGYVRWTENRNMLSFVDLISEKKLNIDDLITHVFDFQEAPDAYSLILSGAEHKLGVLLRYKDDISLIDKVSFELNKSPQKPGIGFVGAGSFAQNYLLPNLPPNSNLLGVCTAGGVTASNVAKKYGFNYATSNDEKLFSDPLLDTVFVATRHNLHFEFVKKAIERGKNVFVEKPLCLTIEELEIICHLYLKTPVVFLLGFNRRFAPLVRMLKDNLSSDLPISINYRINAGFIPKNHWVHDPEIGGGRIIGEVCHFVDLCTYLTGSPIVSVYAIEMETKDSLMDTISITLKFANDSIASVTYFSNGNKSVSKEYLEVFSGGMTFILDDFRSLTLFGEKTKIVKLKKQDKGHHTEVTEFLESIEKGVDSPIPFAELYHSSLATFKIIESIKDRSVIAI